MRTAVAGRPGLRPVRGSGVSLAKMTPRPPPTDPGPRHDEPPEVPVPERDRAEPPGRPAVRGEPLPDRRRDRVRALDVGQEDTLDEVIDLIRELDFPLSKCKMLIATHADADHVQGLAAGPRAAQGEDRRPPPGRAPLESRRRDRDLRQHLGPELRHPDAAVQDRRAARRGRRDQGRQAEAEGLAHARPHAGAAQLQARQPALQRRQHLQGRRASG